MYKYQAVIDNNCYIHKKRIGVSKCNICMNVICEECKRIKSYKFANQDKVFITKIYCKKCCIDEPLEKKYCCVIL